jgi:galactokinase
VHNNHVKAFAPGRVNLIGEHTDYNGGLALPFAISKGVTVQASPRQDHHIEADALDLEEHDRFPAGEPDRARGWRAFVRGIVAELQRAQVPIRGANLEITSEVPQGAGLSSSAALEVALALALLALADGEDIERIKLAKLCSRVENEWVGAHTGLLDQLASLFGEPEKALRIDFRTLDVRPVALELGDHKLVTLDSGASHTHAGSGYNERREECAQACRLLGIDTLRDASADQARELPEPLAARAGHVISENRRVEEAVGALERHDFEELGRLLDASHRSLRNCYEVSVPAVEDAVERLRDAGALGARIVGGGFGGNVLGLLPPDADAPEGALEVRPGGGARVVER